LLNPLKTPQQKVYIEKKHVWNCKFSNNGMKHHFF